MNFNLGICEVVVEIRYGTVRRQVKEALKQSKVHAVKKYRELIPGASLADAVVYVDRLLPPNHEHAKEVP